MPIDAEDWLAQRGVPRERVTSPVQPGEGPERSDAGSTPPPGVKESVDLAGQAARDAMMDAALPEQRAAPTRVEDDESLASRADDVDAALLFVRRSTSNAPQSEGRLRGKLLDRGHDEATIDEALARARQERLVDDAAMLAALIVERRARGHAGARLRRDLRSRGFTGEQVDAALERSAPVDPAAEAFAVAREQAARQRSVEPEVAVRRTVAALVRRGHGEALARKVARDAVYADREPQDIAGR